VVLVLLAALAAISVITFAATRLLRARRPSPAALSGTPSPAEREFGRLAPRVSVVVPALNEEESIDWVIDNIPAWVSEVVLVDGLSVDGTELVVTDRRHDVVIVHQRTRGKGAALRAGFAAASGDIVVMIDADGSTDPREMGSFVDALVAGADFAKGSRNLPGGGSTDFTLLRHLGNLGFVHAANLLFGSRFTDLCYGYCAFWRRDLDRLALTADGFEIEMELILSAVKSGLNIAEVPSMELERRAGNSNLNAWTDGKRVLQTMVRERFRSPDPTFAEQMRISLTEVELAAHGTEQWVPAGTDRRRYHSGEHRYVEERRAGYGGDGRRDQERRTAPERTVRVLYAFAGGGDVIVKRAHSNDPLHRESL
jgi:glycosyltransferase involved in cell wall biosynthesis